MNRDIDKLIQSLKGVGNKPQLAQLCWATCTSVDWEAKTMEAKGVADDLSYYDVMLGLGFLDIKPKAGAMCIIGVLEGQSAYTFLITASEVEEVQLNSDKLIINEGENGSLVKIEALKERLNTCEKKFNDLINAFSNWIPIPNDGGAALKTSVASWISTRMQETKVEDLEDDKITH